MTRVCILAILLIAASADATGLWLNGQEQVASSASVVTNGGVEDRSHITNRTFSSGIGGYTASQGAIDWNAASQALHGAVFNENPLEIKYTYTPPVTNTDSARIWFRYYFTNADERSVKWKIVNNDNGFESTQGSLANNGQKTMVSGAVMSNFNGFGGGFNGTNLWLQIYTLGDASDIFIDYIGVTSTVDTTSITTNSGSGVSGPTFDGIVPLSTNRHLWIDGRPSS